MHIHTLAHMCAHLLSFLQRCRLFGKEEGGQKRLVVSLWNMVSWCVIKDIVTLL